MFDFNQFVTNLKSNKNIKNIVMEKDNTVSITYFDNLKINVIINYDSYHKFYTVIDNKNFGNYFYVGEMPHDNFKDLYYEIYRMSKPNLRNNSCKSNYYKSY